MAVQMKPSVHAPRSDFMISDAAMSQRLAEIDAEQAAKTAQFAKILGGFDGMNGSAGSGANGDIDVGDGGAVDSNVGGAEEPFALQDVERALRELQSDDENFERALNALDAEIRRRATSADDGKSDDGVFCNKTTGEELPSDPHELAKMVVEGKLDIRDIPDELMTPELMNAIIALMIEMRANGGEKSEDKEQPEEVFDPAVAAVNEQKLSREASSEILRELYGIVEKHNEKQSEDKETILDGISEPIDETETLPSVATEEVRAQDDEGVFEEILDNIAESIDEDVKQAVQLDEAVQKTQVSEISEKPTFSSESTEIFAEQTVQATQKSDTSGMQVTQKSDTLGMQAAQTLDVSSTQTEEVSAEQMPITDISEKPVREYTATVMSDTGTAEVPAEQDTVLENVVAMSEAQTVAAPMTADADTTASAPKTAEERNVGFTDVQAAEATAEQVQTAAQSEQSNDEQTQLGARAQFSGAAADVKQTAKSENSDIAEEFKSVAEAVSVKDNGALKSEKTKTAQREFTSNDPASRVQNASEEFEMLKSAKLSKIKGAENDGNGAGETKLGSENQNANALMSDQPIVFKRADGTEIEVRPSEIVDQAAKLVQKAVEEAREQSEYSLILNPEELGRITVKLIKSAEGTVSVTIAAENARTQRILEQHSELMQNNLRSNGVDLESWQTVAESRQETYAQDYNGSSKNPYFRRDGAQHNDEEHGDTTFAELIASM